MVDAGVNITVVVTIDTDNRIFFHNDICQVAMVIEVNIFLRSDTIR